MVVWTLGTMEVSIVEEILVLPELCPLRYQILPLEICLVGDKVGTMSYARIKALLFISLPPLILFSFFGLERLLLARGVLNKRDLGFVGGEQGTIWEYVTNVWHWDAFGGILFLITGFLVLSGLCMLWGARRNGPK